MRFKKLKIFVGISMILFILIVGNILAFGLLKKYDNESDDSKIVAPVYVNKPFVPSSTSQQTTSTVTKNPSTPTPSSSTTVVQQTTRTRAS